VFTGFNVFSTLSATKASNIPDRAYSESLGSKVMVTAHYNISKGFSYHGKHKPLPLSSSFLL
jgi:hypothetical protein